MPRQKGCHSVYPVLVRNVRILQLIPYASCSLDAVRRGSLLQTKLGVDVGSLFGVVEGIPGPLSY